MVSQHTHTPLLELSHLSLVDQALCVRFCGIDYMGSLNTVNVTS